MIMRNNKGFTLMELMVATAIVALMAAIAIPGMISWFPRYRLDSGSRDLYDIVQFARIRAVKQNISTGVIIDTGNDSYELVVLDAVDLVDSDASGIPDSVEDGTAPTILEEGMPGDVRITGTTFAGNLIIFNARGFPNAAGTITIASTAANAGQRFINVTPSGGLSLTRP
jgi:type IV fimbrial biogenesis protein FimT